MINTDEIAGKGNSLNTHFRQNDTRTGTWLSVDPEADKFPSMSPYVLYGGNPVLMVDPRGDLPYDRFDSRHAAVHDFAKNYNFISLRIDREVATSIWKGVDEKGFEFWTYTVPDAVAQTSANGSLGNDKTLGLALDAVAHTHGPSNSIGVIKVNPDKFSDGRPNGRGDKKKAEDLGVPNFMISPKGLIFIYDPTMENETDRTIWKGTSPNYNNGKMIFVTGFENPDDSNRPIPLIRINSDVDESYQNSGYGVYDARTNTYMFPLSPGGLDYPGQMQKEWYTPGSEKYEELNKKNNQKTGKED